MLRTTKCFIKQLPLFKPARSAKANTFMFANVRECEAVWLQGIIVHKVGNQHVWVIDDGTGAVQIDCSSFKNQYPHFYFAEGSYLCIIGHIEGDKIIVWKIKDLSFAPHREVSWIAEVIHVQKTKYFVNNNSKQ